MDGIIFTTISDMPGFSRNYGPTSIAGILRNHGYKILVVDFFDLLSVEDIREIAKKYVTPQTRFIGFSGSFFTNTHYQKKYVHNAFFRDMTEIFEIFKGIPILYGGSNIRAVDTNIPEVDHWFYDDSEGSMLLFLKYPTMFEMLFGRRIVDSSAYLFQSFHTTPIKWTNEDFLFENEVLPLETRRGCTEKCAFCNRPPERYSTKNLVTIHEELHANREFTTRYFVVDDMFTDDIDRILKICCLFKQMKIEWLCFGRVKFFQKYPELREVFLESGCYAVQFGIESMSNKSLRAIHKGPPIEQQIETLEFLREKWKDKIHMSSTFIVGLPYQNLSDIQKTFDRLDEFPLDYGCPSPLFIAEKGAHADSLMSLNPMKYGYVMGKDGWTSMTSDMTWRKSVEFCSDFYNNKPLKPFWIFGSRLMNLGYSAKEVYFGDMSFTDEWQKIWNQKKLDLFESYKVKLLANSSNCIY